MKSLLHLILVSFFLLFLSAISVNAESEFEIHLSNFYQKQERATKILKEIETELKDGIRDSVCARQREAANYGIEATESLIKAFKINGSKNQIENLKSGLNKWKELRDYC